MPIHEEKIDPNFLYSKNHCKADGPSLIGQTDIQTLEKYFSIVEPCSNTFCQRFLTLYGKAIELVCGGSPKICVLVEGKAQDRVKSVMDIINGNYLRQTQPLLQSNRAGV